MFIVVLMAASGLFFLRTGPLAKQPEKRRQGWLLPR